jgi:arylsulfatase A-like enzyme
LDCLEQTGLESDTVVIFAADHGQTLGSHGGLTDKGWHHFEEIERIPFIVRLPERYGQVGGQPGRVLEQWISLVDVYPSLLDMAGVDLAEVQVHGRSIVPLLKGETVPWRDSVFVEFNGVNSLATSMVTVRKGDCKYGWNCASTDELYNLAVDPYETRNLIGDPIYATCVTEMRQLLDGWMVETGYPGLRMYRQSRMGVPWG